MANQLSTSDINHLRRLLGYVRCEIGQPPDEMAMTVNALLPDIEPVSDEGKMRLIRAYQKSDSVPKYVRAAIKALEKIVWESPDDKGDLSESKFQIESETRKLPALSSD